MIPTRTVIDSLRFDEMANAAGKATDYAAVIHDDAHNLRSTITGLDWSGPARNAADDRADREHRQLGRVSSAFTALASAISHGQICMSHICATLKQRACGYESDGYEVAGNWKVTDGYNYGLADALAVGHPDQQQRLADLKAARSANAATATAVLTRLATEFGSADQSCASAIRAACGSLHVNAPVTAGVGAGRGHDVARALREGRRLSDDELTSLRWAANLSEDQLAAIRNGHPVDIPQGQYDFLRTLMAGMGDSTIDDITGMGVGEQREAVQSSLADAFQVMSMPALATAAGDQGGLRMLPTSVQTLLTDNLIGQTYDRTYVDGPGLPARRQRGVVIERIGDLTSFTDMLDKGRSDLRVGSDVDRGLIKQGAEVSAATSDPPMTISRSMSSISGGNNPNDVLNRIFDVAGDDKIAVHDFLTGHNMDVTCADGRRFDADSHLDGIMGHHWGADHGGVDELFEWTGTDATSPNRFLAGQAHESANALGHYLGDSSNVGIAQDLGVNSPHMAQTLATSLSPYLGGFSGATGIPTLDADTLTSGELHNVFRAMDSDPGSAAIFNHAGSQWQNYMAYQYGLRPDQGSLGHAAGILNQAMTNGYTDELEYLKRTAYHGATATYEEKIAAYSQAVAGIGAIPGIGAYATAALPPQLSESLFGPAPTPGSVTSPQADGLTSVGVPSLNDPEVLEFSKFVGYAQAHPEVAENNSAWFTDGQPDWHKITADPESLNAWRNFMGTLAGGPMAGWESNFGNGVSAPDEAGRPENPRRPPIP